MAGGSEIVQSELVASINFATASNGGNEYLKVEFGEAKTVIGINLHCVRTVTLANGTNTKFAIQGLINPQTGLWRSFARCALNNASVDAAFNGFTWANGNTIAENGGPVYWTASAGDDIAPLNIYGMRLYVDRDAGDATLAGTITNAFLTTIPW